MLQHHIQITQRSQSLAQSLERFGERSPITTGENRIKQVDGGLEPPRGRASLTDSVRFPFQRLGDQPTQIVHSRIEVLGKGEYCASSLGHFGGLYRWWFMGYTTLSSADKPKAMNSRDTWNRS